MLTRLIKSKLSISLLVMTVFVLVLSLTFINSAQAVTDSNGSEWVFEGRGHYSKVGGYTPLNYYHSAENVSIWCAYDVQTHKIQDSYTQRFGDSGQCPVKEPGYETIDGKCGSNAKAYNADEKDWDGVFCAAGTLPTSSLFTKFPGMGQSTSWTCNGSNGGKDASCSASRGKLKPKCSFNIDIWGKRASFKCEF